MNDKEIKRIIKERNEALFSLDREKILNFYEKYNGKEARTLYERKPDIVFWGGVYKAICNIKGAPPELVCKAVDWLTSHNMTTF